ncbi:microtubule-associated serine/threonine-protein kinase 3-like [Talpa occidentalis]|uniref:microtubule-associated serine/threonine-protein kinase 3-like n=1 Tax=Talpa occidentalis TaxID=50954 RepID=UPI00188F1C4E|nr:microtubule-associated serine/threonine-protein kinase 3-like [Talpa occidentalis]
MRTQDLPRGSFTRPETRAQKPATRRSPSVVVRSTRGAGQSLAQVADGTPRARVSQGHANAKGGERSPARTGTGTPTSSRRSPLLKRPRAPLQRGPSPQPGHPDLAPERVRGAGLVTGESRSPAPRYGESCKLETAAARNTRTLRRKEKCKWRRQHLQCYLKAAFSQDLKILEGTAIHRFSCANQEPVCLRKPQPKKTRGQMLQSQGSLPVCCRVATKHTSLAPA